MIRSRQIKLVSLSTSVIAGNYMAPLLFFSFGMAFKVSADSGGNKRRVIAHSMVCMGRDHCMPDRPLDSWKERYQVAADLGINELTLFMNRDHAGQLNGLIKSSRIAAKIPDFSISICIGLPRCKMERDWLKVVEKWCDAAKNNPGISKIDGRPVIWTYHAGAFKLADWKKFIAKLHKDGYNPFFIGDMFAFAFGRKKQYLSEVDQWAEVMDSLYMFGPYFKDKRFEAMLNAIDKAQKKKGGPGIKIGTVGGGYWRWGNNHQGSSQLYEGTGKVERNWQFNVKNRERLDWVHFTTWNDYLEHTMVEPSRNTAGIKGELLKHYGAIFKGIADPVGEQYWITAPAELKNGPDGLKEYVYQVRGLNIPKGKKAEVKLVFRNDLDKVIRTENISLTPARPVYRFNWQPASGEFKDSHYLTMSADVLSPSGKYSGSLPVLVWPEKEDRVMYKAPRAMRLLPPDRVPAPPVIRISDKGVMTVTPLPDADNPDYRVDILYDMHSKGLEGVNLGNAVVGKKQLPEYSPFDPYYFKRGFRQAAVITRDGRVSWSRPVWVEKDLPPVMKDAPKFDLKKITSQPFKAVKINFQAPRAKTPSGYMVDKGLPFGNRGKGYYYGWTRNVTTFSRERKLNKNVLIDTLIPFRYYLSSWGWSIALPNGRYKVELSLGDVAFRHTPHLLVDDKLLVDPTPNQFGCDKYTLDVEIKDHLLKLKSAPGKGAAINYIIITPVKR